MDEITKKRCSKCGEVKALREFAKCRKSKDGLQGYCLNCSRDKRRQWYVENCDHVKKYSRDRYHNKKPQLQAVNRAWKEENRERVKEYQDDWYRKNREQQRSYKKWWRSANPEYRIQYDSKRLAENPDHVRALMKKGRAKRLSTAKGKLTNNLSCAIHRLLKKGSKNRRHWEMLTGFTIDQLRVHLEKQFTPEMNWGNYGSYWHVDHKIPVVAFNFSSPDDIDFKRCWSLKNLQPLEKIKNISKGARLDRPFQPSLAISA